MRFRSVAWAKQGISNKVNMINQNFHPERDSMNAYIVFSKVESVANSLVENGTLFHEKHLRVDYSTYDPVSYIFIEISKNFLNFAIETRTIQSFCWKFTI